MLRDFTKTSTIGSADLSTDRSHSVIMLLGFIDKHINGFPSYYSTSVLSDKENYITFLLVNYFNALLNDESEGYNPNKFSFVKNPSQPASGQEADLGVVILNKSKATSTIIEFESKRLSKFSNNTEYVYGIRGGMERFKREQHGEHLTICGMFGYVQTKTIQHWFDKINEWISDLAVNNKDHTIDWRPQPEKLVMASGTSIEKYESLNKRSKKKAIKLYHYFIDLTHPRHL